MSPLPPDMTAWGHAVSIFQQVETGRPRPVLPRPVLALALALLLPIASASAATHTDFPAARKAAQDAGRDIAVIFLGSDWQDASRRFDRSVIADPKVAAALAAEFEVLRIDAPDRPTEEQQKAAKANRDLKVTVWNFPALALLDREGRAYASWTGLADETPAALLAKLDAGRRIRAHRDAAWAEAEKAAGVEQARLLGRGLAEVDPDLVRGNYDGVLKEIKASDPDDAAGYHRRFTFRMNAFFEGTIEPFFKDKEYDQALEKIAAELKNAAYTTDQRQQILGARFQVLRRMDRKADAEKTLNEIIRLNATNHMGVGAKGYLHYLNDPIEVKGEWATEHLRPWYQEWRMDVSGVVTSAGAYEVRFVRTDGPGLQVSNVCLVVGNEIIDRTDVDQGGGKYRVQTGIPNPGPRVELVIHARSGGWLNSRGRIEVRREAAGAPL